MIWAYPDVTQFKKNLTSIANLLKVLPKYWKLFFSGFLKLNVFHSVSKLHIDWFSLADESPQNIFMIVFHFAENLLETTKYEDNPIATLWLGNE